MLSFLLTIANESDREKIEYIYYKYHNDMIRFTRCRLKNANVFSYELAAEDVVQNSFLKIVKYIDAIDFTRSEKELKSYIFSIVANEINNYKCDIFEYDDIENFSNNIFSKVPMKNFTKSTMIFLMKNFYIAGELQPFSMI